MSEHTPGPWKAICQTVQIDTVCFVESNNCNYPMGYANARLIAAAPELLAALLRFADAAERGATEFFDMKGSCLREARAAIAKATQREG